MEIWDFLVYWTVKTVTNDNENGKKIGKTGRAIHA